MNKNIPDEKFEGMQMAVNKSIGKDVKNLKVTYIDIQDFKNIDGISTELGDINIIGGNNGEGKSSFVEAILTSIQAQKFYGNGKVSPASLVKKGEDKAVVRIQLEGKSTEITIHREFRKGTTKNPAGKTVLEATIDGEKISQASLDSLLNALTLDPLKLANLTQSEQIHEVKQTVGLDTTEIDAKIEKAVEHRKESKDSKAHYQSIYDDAIAGGVPEKVLEESMDGLMEKRKKFQEREDLYLQFDRKDAEITELTQKLKKAEAELTEIQNKGKALNVEIEKTGYKEIKDVDEAINGIQEKNKAAQVYSNFEKTKEHLRDAAKEVDEDEKNVKKLRSERTKLISGSNLPEYMEIDEENGILVDKTEYRLLNTARKIEVGIDLVLISGTPLKLIRIENGGELDNKTLEAVSKKITESGFQLFLERPIVDEFDTLIISDGEVIDK